MLCRDDVDEFLEQRPQAVRALTTELLPGTQGELIGAALHLVAAGTTRGGRVTVGIEPAAGLEAATAGAGVVSSGLAVLPGPRRRWR